MRRFPLLVIGLSLLTGPSTRAEDWPQWRGPKRDGVWHETGILQTFPADYREGIQLGTQSQWGWGSADNPEGFTLDDVLSPYDAHGRQVVYPDGLGKLKNVGNPERAKKANTWLRENPHRLQLGRLGLSLVNERGERVKLAELREIRQVLDLWMGTIDSRFECNGKPVRVQTFVHP